MEKSRSDHLDKEHVADCFKASSLTYEENAVVQKEISRQLVAILQRFTHINYARVLEIGCCTGNLTEMLCNSAAIDLLLVNDLVPDFCASTEQRIARNVGRVQHLPGDIEKAILPENLGLVISSSTFQWMVNLPVLMGKIATALVDEGYLAFSIFGPGTMGEIQALTGRGLKYHTSDELAAMLAENFRVLSIHSATKILFFPSVRAILRHIRQTGVGGLACNRLELKKLREFERRYVEQFSSPEGLSVTYVSTFVIAKKMKVGRP